MPVVASGPPSRSDHCPRSVLWLFFFVGVLRGIPFLATRVMNAPTGASFLPVGYLPKDFLQYLGFIRQAGHADGVLLSNPFTTDPQQPSFILLFHTALGLLGRVSSIPPEWMLELSRIPLLLLLAHAFWRLLQTMGYSHRTSRLACLLYALGGGVEWLAHAVGDQLSEPVLQAVRQNTWSMYGWSGFASFFNPLWIASLVIGFHLLRITLDRVSPVPARAVWVFALFLTLFWTHPYSAVAFGSIFGCQVMFAAVLQERPYFRSVLLLSVSAAAAALVSFYLVSLQLRDPVFSTTSSGIFGTQGVSVVWYPLTLGLLLPMAVVAWRKHTFRNRAFLGSWLMAVVLLHTSYRLNGYHFVFYLAPAIAILCAPVAERLLAIPRGPAVAGWVRLLVGVLLLFANSLIQTATATNDTLQTFFVSSETAAIVERLGREPAGNVFCPPVVGNILPAVSDHSVYVGHWFMTPSFRSREQTYERAARGLMGTLELGNVLQANRIDYIVLPNAQASSFLDGTGNGVLVQKFSTLSLARVRRTGSTSPPFESRSRSSN